MTDLPSPISGVVMISSSRVEKLTLLSILDPRKVDIIQAMKDFPEKYKTCYSGMKEVNVVIDCKLLEPHRKEIQDMLLELPQEYHSLSNTPVQWIVDEDVWKQMLLPKQLSCLKPAILNIIQTGGDVLNFNMGVSLLGTETPFHVDMLLIIGQALGLVNVPIRGENYSPFLGRGTVYQIMLKMFTPPVNDNLITNLQEKLSKLGVDRGDPETLWRSYLEFTLGKLDQQK